MSLSFTSRQFRAMSRRDFYRMALRAILAAGYCTPAQEQQLIMQLRREEEVGA